MALTDEQVADMVVRPLIVPLYPLSKPIEEWTPYERRLYRNLCHLIVTALKYKASNDGKTEASTRS